MTKQETYMQFIIDELQNGNVEAEKVCAVFCTKFQKSERTFYNHWNIAQERYKEAQILINEQKAKDYTDAEIKRNNELILSREKILEMQSNVVKLAYNEVVNTKGKEPNKISAFNYSVERLNKMQGYDAANKVAQTDTEGNNILDQKNATIVFNIS